VITQEEVKRRFEYKEGKLYWRISPSNNVKVGDRAGYVQKKRKYSSIRAGGEQYFEHRLIFLYFHGYVPKYLDHISDKLTREGIKDNHIENLQPITNGANLQKSTKTRGSSEYRGVYWNQRETKFHSQAYLDNKRIHLGYYDNEVEAAFAYDQFVIKHFGKHCYLNFPTYLDLGILAR